MFSFSLPFPISAVVRQNKKSARKWNPHAFIFGYVVYPVSPESEACVSGERQVAELQGILSFFWGTLTT